MEKAETPKSMEVNDKRQKLNGILSKTIIGILLADAIIGSVFGLVALISGDKVLFEEHKFLIIYAVIADIVFWIMASIKISKRMVEKKQAKEKIAVIVANHIYYTMKYDKPFNEEQYAKDVSEIK